MTNPNLAEQIRETCERLPPALQQEALRFVQFLEKTRLAERVEDAHSDAQTLLRDLVAIAESVPEQELRKVPTDGSINADQYLYGAK